MDQASVEPFDPDQYASWVKAAPQPDQQQTVEPFDPQQYASWTSGDQGEEQPSEPKTSMLGAAAGEAFHSLGPAAGAIAGSILAPAAVGTMVGGPLGTVAGLGVGLAGALGGSLVGGMAQRGAEEAIGIPESKGILGEEYGAAAAKEHPYSQFAGGLAPNLAAFEGASAKAAARLLSGGIYGATELGTEKAQTGEIDPLKVLGAAAFGAATPNPKPWLNKLTGHVSQVGAGKLTGRNEPDTVEAKADRKDVNQIIPTVSENRGNAAEAPTSNSEDETFPNPNYTQKRNVAGAAPQPDPESPGINTGPDQTLKAATDQIEPARAETPAEAPPAPQVEQAAQPQEGGVPFVMTNDMKQRLGAAGKTPEEIYNMTPQQAHEFLNAQTAEAAPVAPYEGIYGPEHVIELPGERGQIIVDNNNPLVSGAMMDKLGVLHVDKSIPRYDPKLLDKTGQPADIYQLLGVHETEEANAKGTYPERHKIATAAEKTTAEENGVDWKLYTDKMNGWLSEIEKQKQPNLGIDFVTDPLEAIGHHANKIGPEGTVEPETVVGAAVKLKDGRVFTAPTHSEAIDAAVKAVGGGVEFAPKGQGLFQTSTGRIIDHKESLSLPSVREALGLGTVEPSAQPTMQAMKRGPRLPGQTGTPKTVEDLEAASKNLLKAIGEKIPEQPKAAEEAINAGAKAKNVAPPLVQNAFEKAVNNSLPAKFLAIRGSGTKGGLQANFIMRGPMGEAALEEHMFKKGLAPIQKAAHMLPPEVSRDFQIAVQEGRPVNEFLPQLQPLADFWRARAKYWAGEISKRQMVDPSELQENYWRQVWLNKPAEINQALSVWHTGNKGALKEKIYPTIQDGEKAGLTLDPDFIKTMTKYDQSMRLTKQLNDILADAQDQKILRDKPAFGLTKLMAKGLNGREYFAPDDFAQNFNRYYDPGVYTSEPAGKLYDIGRKTNGFITAIKLAGPIFHGSMVSGESMITKMGSSFYTAAAGDFKTAIQRFAEVPIAPAKYVMGKMNDRYIAEWEKAGTDPDEAVRTAVRLYKAVNGAFEHTHDPTTEYTKNAEAWSDAFRRAGLQGVLKEIRQNVGTASPAMKPVAVGQEVFRALGRTMQEISKPLFEWYIPRLKLAMAMEQLTDFIRANPSLEENKLQNVAMKIANSVDNRAGLMVHDNIFMPRLIKQLGTLFMTSYSWTTGTFGEIVGGAFGLLNHPSRVNIRNPDFDPRAAYMAAFPVYFGLLAGIYQYMKTGKAPWDTETPGADLVAGRTGGTLKHGQPERAIFPGYLKDVLGWYHDPMTEAENKFSPMWKLTMEMLNNSGWIGGKGDKLISDPNHPFMQRAKEYFDFAANNLKPIYFEQQGKKQPGSNISRGESLAAIRPAPAFVSGQNPAEYKYFERKWKERQKAERMAQ